MRERPVEDILNENPSEEPDEIEEFRAPRMKTKLFETALSGGLKSALNQAFTEKIDGTIQK